MDADDGRTEVGLAPEGPPVTALEPAARLGAESWIEAASDIGSFRSAGFWRRAFALVVDLLVVWVFFQVRDLVVAMLARYDLIAQAFRYTYTLVIPAAYFVLTHGTGGQTLGKRFVHVRVVGSGGESIGYLQALGRLAATCLSILPLGLGFLAVAVRRDKRALHDRLAGTRVIRVG